MTTLTNDLVRWVPTKRGIEAIVYNQLVEELGDPQEFNFAFQQHANYHRVHMTELVYNERLKSEAIIEKEFAKNIREWIFGPTIIIGELID